MHDPPLRRGECPSAEAASTERTVPSSSETVQTASFVSLLNLTSTRHASKRGWGEIGHPSIGRKADEERDQRSVNV